MMMTMMMWRCTLAAVAAALQPLSGNRNGFGPVPIQTLLLIGVCLADRQKWPPLLIPDARVYYPPAAMALEQDEQGELAAQTLFTNIIYE